MRFWQRWTKPRWHGRRAQRIGSAAETVTGAAPDGTPVEIGMDGRWAVLLFLTSSCFDCRKWWEDVAEHRSDALVIVTPSPSTESARQVADMAPDGVEVVMSSETWHAYQVQAAPWCVVVAGGVIVADGPAPASWADLEAVGRPG